MTCPEIGCHGCIIPRDPSDQDDAGSEASEDGVSWGRIPSARDTIPDSDGDADDLSGVRTARFELGSGIPSALEDGLSGVRTARSGLCSGIPSAPG